MRIVAAEKEMTTTLKHITMEPTPVKPERIQKLDKHKVTCGTITSSTLNKGGKEYVEQKSHWKKRPDFFFSPDLLKNNYMIHLHMGTCLHIDI